MKNTLTTLALTGTLALGLVGCGNNNEMYNGKIGDDKVRFIKADDALLNFSHSELEIIKPDDRKINIEFHYMSNKPHIDSVNVYKIVSNTTNIDSYNYNDVKVMAEADQLLQNYLNNIDTTNTFLIGKSQLDKERKGIQDLK